MPNDLTPPEPSEPVPSSTSATASGPLLSLFQWALLVLVLLSIAGALYLRRRHVPPDDPNPPTELIVVQLNDIYRLDAVRNGKRGGLARVASFLRQIKAQNPKVPVIVLHAGDFLAPSLESDLFHGAQMIDALNFLHRITPIYAVPGNHEFDYKEKEKDYLVNAIARSEFHWTASNLERGDTALLSALRDNVSTRVVETFGKVKVGIFALTIDASHRGLDQPYAPISGDYLAVARREIEQLERDGADIIFGLTHLDITDDREIAKLRRDHPRFRWIAGGHEHSLERDPGWPGGALITKGDSNARTVWKISVVFRGGNPEVREESVAIDETIKPDPDFEREVENLYRYKMRNERPYLDNVIATQAGRCYDGTEEAVRNRESDWGSFLADNMRTIYKNVSADVAVINGGSIRIDDTFCDRITFEQLERTLAFESPIVFIKLTGKQLKEHILDDSVSSKKGDGRFLQVSGVSFRRDPGGKAVKDLKIQAGKAWVPMKEDKQYVVAVPDFLFGCGDGYQFRKHVTEYIPPGPDLKAITYGALAALVKKQPTTTVTRILDLPAYAQPATPATGVWKPLTDAERQCKP